MSEWVSESCSVVSDSLRPYGLYSQWDSPGQNTRVGSLFLLQGLFPIGTVQSIGLQRVGQNWAPFTFTARTHVHARVHTHIHTHTGVVSCPHILWIGVEQGVTRLDGVAAFWGDRLQSLRTYTHENPTCRPLCPQLLSYLTWKIAIMQATAQIMFWGFFCTHWAHWGKISFQ